MGFAPGLYVTATPIGNARDITLRALDLLAACDVIVAEDTRVTAKLLAIHGLSKPMKIYNEHVADRAGPEILKRIAEGAVVALVSDAGTPLLSDPGGRLVREALAQGLNVVPLPGASAFLAALVASGIETSRVLFAGFLPPRAAARRAELKELANIPAALVFYEAPSRIAEALADMAALLGDREAAVARELTKLHEDVRRGPLADLAREAAAGEARGEYVIVVAAPTGAAPEADLDALLKTALKSASLKEAVADVAAETGVPRREVYARALKLTKKSP